MKQILAIIALTVLLIAVGAFAYKSHQDATFWKNNANNVTELNRDLEENYNRANVKYVQAIRDLAIADENLKKKIKERTVVNTVYVEVPVYVKGGGQLQEPTTNETGLSYEDFRLRVDVDTKTRQLSYSLTQKFKMNLYIQKGDDYRAELLELNKDTGEVVESFEVSEFDVIKVIDNNNRWNFGFNLMAGGGYVYGTAGHDWDVHLLFNFISHGETHLDSTFRVLNIGAGKVGAVMSPASYRFSNHLPFFSDIHLYPYYALGWKKTHNLGVGLATTF